MKEKRWIVRYFKNGVKEEIRCSTHKIAISTYYKVMKEASINKFDLKGLLVVDSKYYN